MTPEAKQTTPEPGSSTPGGSRWRGRVALVTGASSGIGREIVRELTRAGMRVAFCARRRARLEALAQELPDAQSSLPLVCDLQDEVQIAAMFAELRARWDGVDVLVNNAGFARGASLLDGASSDWRAILEVNVLALAICSREAIADMRRRDVAGHVINLSSMAAHRVPVGSAMYSASKYAVRSLTEGLRGELRAMDSAIRVTAISPGYVETEFALAATGDPEHARRTYARYPCLQAGDIARTVRFALDAPPHMQVHDILIRPTRQPL
ncbi:MAG: SDR family NAD(P)-dependent oxidoreductase [Myxococcales bacterium]|nr:SDR family NAD(P)-dependent oxidoreductase [Myxococcales bacterium]